MSILDELNDEQKAAVQHGDGPMRIIAGAGTGKTQALTARFVALVERGVPAHEILALTFSVKAANVMSTRVLRNLQGGHRKLWIQTFHSFCRRLLEEWQREETGLSVVVADASESRALAGRAIAGISDEQLVAYRGQHGRENLMGDVLTLSSRAKDELLGPDDVYAYISEMEEPPARLRDLAFGYRLYQQELARTGRIDFGDMGLQVVNRLRSDPSQLQQVRDRFSHVLVDEFQDTNLAQFELLRLLVPEGGDICVVGDPNQSIYAFRGGRPEYVEKFEDYFSDAATYRLTTNYRSCQPILDRANTLIQVNTRDSKSELTSHDASLSGVVELVQASDQVHEAELIARRIRSLVNRTDNPVSYADIAVLMRSTERHSEHLQRAFKLAGIPFSVGGRSAADLTAVYDTLAMVRLIAGVGSWRDAARVVARNGVSAIALRGIERQVGSDPALDALLDPESVTRAFEASEEEDALGSIRSLMRRAGQIRELSLAEQLYESMVVAASLREGTGQETAAILASMLSQAEVLQDDAASTEDLLQQIGAGLGVERSEPAGAERGVQIVTIHAAKGLEWPVVFVAGLADGIFPLPMRLDHEFDVQDIDSWRDPERAEESEAEREAKFLTEERRLAYVAMTRAKHELYLTSPRGSDTRSSIAPSIFLTDAGFEVDPDEPVRPAGVESPVTVSDLGGRIRSDRSAALSHGVDIENAGDLFGSVLAAEWAATGVVEGALPLRTRNVPDAALEHESLRLSASQVETYAECPRRFFYEKTLRLEPDEDAPALTLGNVVHEVLQKLNDRWRSSGMPPSRDEVDAMFESVWPDSGFQFESQRRQYKSRARGMIHRYYDMERTRQPTRKPVEIEKWFEVPYGPHTFRGKADVVLVDEEGTETILDYKTGNPKYLKADESLQLFLYRYWWRHDNAESDPDAAFLALRQKDDGGFDVGQEWDLKQEVLRTRDDATDESNAETLEALIGGIQAGIFTPKPGYDTCMFCNYRWICPEG